MKRLLYILLLISSLPMMLVRAQECDTIRIVGSIYDEYRDPFVGVQIRLEGTTLGTISDYDGWFDLRVPQPSSPLIVSMQYPFFIKYIQLADSILEDCQYNLNIELSETTAESTIEFKLIDICYHLPVYVADKQNLTILREAIDSLYAGGHKNADAYELVTRDDGMYIRTHHWHYAFSREEQAYGESCKGCIKVGDDWFFIRDEQVAEYFQRTDELHTFSYTITDEIACYCAEKSRKIHLAQSF